MISVQASKSSSGPISRGKRYDTCKSYVMGGDSTSTISYQNNSSYQNISSHQNTSSYQNNNSSNQISYQSYNSHHNHAQNIMASHSQGWRNRVNKRYKGVWKIDEILEKKLKFEILSDFKNSGQKNENMIIIYRNMYFRNEKKLKKSVNFDCLV